MDGCHETFFDPETFFQKHMNQRRQTIGGAGGIGNNVVRFRIILAFIDAHNDCRAITFGRRADDFLLRHGGPPAFGRHE